MKGSFNMKRFIAIIVLAVMLVSLTACNKQLLDVTYEFDRAIIKLPNGEVVEGEVDSWKDYEDGDQMQVVIEGKTYLVHSNNVVMIAD